MAVTLAEAREMSLAMTAAKRRLGFGLKMRFEAVFAAAFALIEEGAIGRPQFGSFSFYQPIPQGERIWYADVGVLRDMLVHVFDLSAWMLGQEPRRVRARTARRIGRAGEDHALIELEYSDEALASIQGGYVPGFPEVAGREDIVFQVVGERGYLVGKRPDTLLVVNREGTRTVPVTPVDAFAAELSAFTAALASGVPLPVSDRDGLRAQAVIDAAERSAGVGGAMIEVAS
jgi:myo-inositol 2-dehydrogenase/D-chiro-inositol 1-dehydrogenase